MTGNKNPETEYILPSGDGSIKEQHDKFLSMIENTDFTISISDPITEDKIDSIAKKFEQLFASLHKMEKPKEDPNNARVEAYSAAKKSIIQEREQYEQAGAENFSVLDQAVQDYKNSDKNKPLGKDDNYKESNNNDDGR